jgi:hypothetical protein
MLHVINLRVFFVGFSLAGVSGGFLAEKVIKFRTKILGDMIQSRNEVVDKKPNEVNYEQPKRINCNINSEPHSFADTRVKKTLNRTDMRQRGWFCVGFVFSFLQLDSLFMSLISFPICI